MECNKVDSRNFDSESPIRIAPLHCFAVTFEHPILNRPILDSKSPILDGLAIRNANRADSRELIRANRFAEKPL